MQGLGDPVLLMNLGSNMRKDRMKKSWAVWFARSILVPISDMCVCVCGNACVRRQCGSVV